ncbi:MAG: CPBP family intramembrane metalloprotease [Clostridia bacterium]|nr:CPBP family intramembrane metalloprotease [Clostridia bacterium]
MKKYIGIVWAALLGGVFSAFSFIGIRYLQGTNWYLFSSALRIIFGIAVLVLMNRIFQRSLRDIFSPKGWKTAFFAGSGFLLYAAYMICAIVMGYRNLTVSSVSLFLSHVILQQLATGFFEEGLFRGLVLEGYFACEKKTALKRVCYAMFSFLLFGAVHVLDGFDAYRFIYTGTIGFAFAAMYLRSRNLLLPMLLHFLYDIPMNLLEYMEYTDPTLFNTWYAANEVMIGIMFLISLVMIVYEKKDKAKEMIA